MDVQRISPADPTWPSHAEHDVLLPAQFSRVFSRDLKLERERLLMFAVLEDGITSYLNHAHARNRRGPRLGELNRAAPALRVRDHLRRARHRRRLPASRPGRAAHAPPPPAPVPAAVDRGARLTHRTTTAHRGAHTPAGPRVRDGGAHLTSAS